MSFTSYGFFYFLIGLLLLHELAPQRTRNALLLLGSLLFYAAAGPRYLLVLVLVAAVAHAAAARIAGSADAQHQRHFLVAGVAANVALLAGFKYAGLLGRCLAVAGVALPSPAADLVLPLGISFYAFKAISYIVDVYRRDTPPFPDFWRCLLYVAFFPQLLAGPIVRAHDFAQQLDSARTRTADSLRLGIKLLGLGFLRKVVVADNLGRFVDLVHRNPAQYSSLDLWTAAYAFAFQLYSDFAGYSEMAVGLGLLFGFRFGHNFDRPYLARSPLEFWQRWHVSLSHWLRDYVFFGLGANRQGAIAGYRNLWVTMLLAGLWHGAGATFLVWGAVHGTVLVLARAWQSHTARPGPAPSRALALLGASLTFHVWTLSLVLFRSASLAGAWAILTRMLLPSPGTFTAGFWLAACAALYASEVAAARFDPFGGFDRLWLPVRALVVAALIWAAILLAPASAQPFLYFRF